MPTINFKGKTFVQNHHLAVKHHQLIPQPDKSLTDKVSLHDNLIIHGDNLIALKALLPTYAGKIKCIYIDPPYNTGNEGWVYNDNMKSPMIQEWLGKVVDKDDLTRHDKWLCMMMPRLKLLREFLDEEGVIFISCDDNEQHRLQMLLDEVFGEHCFIANVVWWSKYTIANDARYFSRQHEYISVYCKNIERFSLGLLPRTEEMNDRYSNPDKDKRGNWKPSPLHAKSGTDNSLYSVVFDNGVSWEAPVGTYPRFSKDNLLGMYTDGRLYFGKDGKQAPASKTFLSEVKKGKTSGTLWKFDEVGSSHAANEELAELLGKGVFQNPKPSKLLRRCFQLTTDKNSIVMDSFAGSGTTGHAVLDLNNEDGGNRKFILIEQDDYADSITAERVRRVIARNEKEKWEKGEEENQRSPLLALQKIEGPESSRPTFSFFTVGEPIEMESILHGDVLPSFTEFARYLFYTATGEEFAAAAINEETGYIGESRNYEVYLFYRPDLKWLKSNALTLNVIRGLPKGKGKQRLVFAPAKYVSDEDCCENKVDFCQLPFEIYRLEK